MLINFVISANAVSFAVVLERDELKYSAKRVDWVKFMLLIIIEKSWHCSELMIGQDKTVMNLESRKKHFRGFIVAWKKCSNVL